jgi:hypothetical protein
MPAVEAEAPPAPSGPTLINVIGSNAWSLVDF